MVKRACLVLIAAFVALSAAASAGEYYYYDADDRYWEYWDGDPAFKVLIPANAYYYVETVWAGRTSLQINLGEKGPQIVIGSLPTTDVNQAWSALSARWAATANSARTTTNSEIQTDMGLTAAFRVLSAQSNTGPDAMVRWVAFRKGNGLVYLMFIGNVSQYSGEYQQHWLKAVHSFIWR